MADLHVTQKVAFQVAVCVRRIALEIRGDAGGGRRGHQLHTEKGIIMSFEWEMHLRDCTYVHSTRTPITISG